MSPYKLIYQIASDAVQEDVRNFPNDGWAKAYALQDLRFRMSMTDHSDGRVSVGSVSGPEDIMAVNWLGTWRVKADGEGTWTSERPDDGPS